MASTGEYKCSWDNTLLAPQDFGRYYMCESCGRKYEPVRKANAAIIWDPWGQCAGYYFFPWNVQQDDSAEKPKPTCTLDVMKIHEEAVEKVLADMPAIQKMIIYRQLFATGMRIDGLDRAIHKEAQKELKALKAAAGTP